ncbi:MAG: DUF4840 domain-containing protein [Segatella copri]|nr:DUF4840 domain-containing protein [Segatella copri]
MKKITLFSILAVLFAAMSFTSCNTDGDSGMNILTLEQQKSFQYAMAAGSYNNMTILYEKKNDANVKNQVDSVESACSISMYGDSTMTMYNFPVAALAEHISNKDLAAAIDKEVPRTIKCKYNVMPNSTSEVAYFIACPEAINLNLTYGTDNKSHKVVLYFIPSQMYYGYCSLKEPRQLGFQFALYQIWVDGYQTNFIQSSTNSANTTVGFLFRNAWKK